MNYISTIQILIYQTYLKISKEKLDVITVDTVLQRSFVFYGTFHAPCNSYSIFYITGSFQVKNIDVSKGESTIETKEATADALRRMPQKEQRSTARAKRMAECTSYVLQVDPFR